MGKDFIIKGIKSVKFLNKNGNEIPDSRDVEPILQETKLDIPIMDLVLHHTVIPYEWMGKEPFVKYGYFGGSSLCESWFWREDKLKKAPEVDLWKMYGLCNEYWHHEYEYWDSKHEKEFRDYRRSKGEDLNNWNLDSSSFDICDNHPINLRIFGDRNEK